MSKFLGIFLFATTLISNPSFANTFSLDSIGVTKKAGKTFIIHRVDEGETLFSLSRRYHVKVDDIAIENPEARNGLYIGQELLVPYVEPAPAPKDARVHVVQQSETLFSIARTYGVSTDDIKRWNNLSDNTIGIGDKLYIKSETTTVQSSPTSTTPTPPSTSGKTHTVQPSETLYSIGRLYGVGIADLKKWNSLRGNDISIGQVLVVAPASAGQPAAQKEPNSSMLPVTETKPQQEEVNVVVKPDISETTSKEVKPAPSTTLYQVDNEAKNTYENKKIVETGFAEVIEGSSDTKKYLALHKSAPIGTIMQVRNEMNNQTVFVRVVGTIPGTGNNNNVLIKVSKKAFDRLGSVDAKFPVEISYIP